MAESTLPVAILKKYPNTYFIETGTARGEGVQTALECGFEEIISIEANPDVFTAACQRFAVCENVTLLLGDSGSVLPTILSGISQQVTFWLDAHMSEGEPELGETVNPCPILFDLRAISGHAVKGHTILIDDIRYFRKGGIPKWHNISLGDIMGAIMDISGDYRISFEDGFDKDDILVAKFKEGDL